MRLELSINNVNKFQSDLASLLTKAGDVLDSFKSVKSSTYRMNGGVGILGNAVEQLEQRIQSEELNVENIQKIQKESEEFLRNTINTDGEVAELVAQNKDSFYKVNPWSKPAVAGSVAQWIGKAVKFIGDSLFGNGNGEGGSSSKGGSSGKGSSANEDKKSFFDRLTSDDPADRSVKSWSTGDHETMLGGVLKASGSAQADVLGYSGDASFSSNWEDGEGAVGIEAGASIEGHLAHGEAEGKVGWLGGSVEGSVGAVEAGVKGALSILDDEGHLAPQLSASAEASAAVAKGEAEVYVGGENLNYHVKGEGSVLAAEASASAGAGMITREKDGKTVTELGVQAEAGASAYLAQGEVKGGFTVLGVEINVGVSGGAGGADAHVGAELTTGKVSLDAGLGLLLGAGASVEVDWSGFTLDDLKFWD